MVFIQFFQDLFHYGLTEKNGFGIDLETAAIFRYCSHFFIIQVDDLSVFPNQRLFFPSEKIRIYPLFRLLSVQFPKIFPNIRNCFYFENIAELCRKVVYSRQLWIRWRTYTFPWCRAGKSDGACPWHLFSSEYRRAYIPETLIPSIQIHTWKH